LIQPRHFKCEGDQLRVYEGKAPTLVAQMGMGGDNVPYVSGERLRRLTVVECERLQGFEDDWSRYGYSVKGETVEISVSQRYKAVGNAVTTNVIAVIGQLILNFLDQKEPN
jgi:DNA (cytosine-5)-methyltransferase 1